MPCSRAVSCLQEEWSTTSFSNGRLDHDQINRVELEKRFQELSAVVQKARDSFSCPLEEEQANPLKDLRTRLFRAKERFHSRLANSSRFPDHGGFYPVERENPFQELRSVLRSARINFVPLLDQYILDNGSSLNANSRSSDSFDQSLKYNSISNSNSNRAESTPTRPFEFEKTQAREQKPPASSNGNQNVSSYHFDDESPSRLHWLLEEETRSRQRSKSSNAPGPAAEAQKYQLQAQAQHTAKAAPAAAVSSAQRLDLLIHEELDRKRESGSALQRLHLGTRTDPQ